MCLKKQPKQHTTSAITKDSDNGQGEVGKQPVLTSKEKASALMRGTDWVPTLLSMTDGDL